MNATIKLLDKYAESCSAALDKDLAARLRVTKQAVSNWRKGHSHPDAESVARMCEATGESVAHWLPLIEADRARNPEARKVWLRLAQMAAAVALVVGVATPPSTAHAEGVVSAHNSGTLYIMSNYENGSGWPVRVLSACIAPDLPAPRRPSATWLCIPIQTPPSAPQHPPH